VGDEGRTFTVIVGTPDADQVPVVVSRPVAIALLPFPWVGHVVTPLGESPTVTVSLLPTSAVGTTDVSITTSDASVAVVNQAVAIPDGGQAATFEITTGNEGTAVLTLYANGEGRTLTVIVGDPPPEAIPNSVGRPVGLCAPPAAECP
jgi:hypothetical protein